MVTDIGSLHHSIKMLLDTSVKNMLFFFGGKRDGIEGFLRGLETGRGKGRPHNTPREPSYVGSGDLDPGIVVDTEQQRNRKNFGRF
jgi:hypothetical protein